MKTLVAQKKERLDVLIVGNEPGLSRTKVAAAIPNGFVTVDGLVVLKPGHPVHPGQTVAYPEFEDTPAHDLTPASRELEFVFEDAHMLVVNKPRGLASHPATSLKEPSLVNVLLAYGKELSSEAGSFRPGIVHRLDKDTTGLMLIAKTDSAHRSLASQIQNKTAERRYVALCTGHMDQTRFRVEAPIARDPAYRVRMKVDNNGKPAATECKVIERGGPGMLIGCRLESGRTHQIRVHLQAVGCPVLGDPIYGSSTPTDAPLQLHAAYIAFDHPVSGERIVRYCPTPDDFLFVSSNLEEALMQW
ncbi:MAG: RluA family pseudouridine synthase [Chthonomonas sp.]|nr:RluA family pseudouridine synthase [Chthonomonas sp.]